MALMITSACINCDVCEPECPNGAIYAGELVYEINPALCTECVGHFDQPQCIEICPIDCILTDPQFVEPPQVLQLKFLRLQAAAEQ